jgi:hypothetical protein
VDEDGAVAEDLEAVRVALGEFEGLLPGAGVDPADLGGRRPGVWLGVLGNASGGS